MKWRYVTHGIPDDMFIRGQIPMTKQEIRAVVLSKLRLMENSIVWDIGAGTGTITVEAALCARNGRVFSVERDSEAVELIKCNVEKFELENVTIIKGHAPEALQDLPDPDRVFIGGSGERLGDILDEVDLRLTSDGIVVIDSITIESTYQAITFFKTHGYITDAISINIAVSKDVGMKTMMLARNPVYIVTGVR
ncbi:cobalt-precorrin-6B (C15)-methyltransferase [Caldanaerobius fijiensis DSM 17918]|uniref:Cobalt-precorrin-6B (C15)-methyltransferase n=1 Tax=Caldanaerobius fijiensis DSM 17918 TaxID=1121256 RepID=A0A1M4YMY7_9THEO|nr:precorrin-6Y C5,15-methyltransferase (decarboxylating) subunit CbiT [Caldanaerobius fijiensis]SHF07150.1 cobalt-precorrin-6B (C15)-methyltransferase [Caldanaerobius fijiensis DSM 17918]